VAIDLVSVGEEFAELDLVVRQLDDGTLTVAADDALPDQARVHVASTTDGLRAWLVLAALAPGQGSRVAATLGPMNQSLTGAKLMVRGTEVRFEKDLDHAPPFARDELQALFRGVVDGAAAHKGAVEDVVAAHAQTVVAPAAPAAAPDEAALPSSYLRGAGQRPGDTATERFGKLGAVPGRGELAPGERSASGRAPTRSSAPSGGGGGLIALGVLGLLVLGGGAAGVWFLQRRGPETEVAVAPPPPPPAATETPAVATPVATEAADPLTLPPSVFDETDETPRPTRRSTSTGQGATLTLTEDQVLADVRVADKRLAAVEAWARGGLDRAPGARQRLLEALGAEVEADQGVGRMIMQSLRDRPLPLAEAIECLPVATGGVKRLLIVQLGEATGPSAAEAVRALEAVKEDTKDLVVEEALLRLGRPRAGAPLRLANARGAEWVLYGDGQPMLQALARVDVKQLASLFEHPDAEVRVAACALVSGAEQPREALALLAPVLRDADASVRQRAAEGLTALRDARASWPLARALLREEAGQTRDVVRDGLSRLPLRETVDLLQQLYARPDAQDRRAAVAGLSAIARPESMPGLVVALKDADRAVRLEAIKALDAAYGQPALRPKVTEGLASIRALGLDRADREVWAIARQLHYQITGRMPDAEVRDRR
jgi:HEAT repeat protein